MNARRIIAVCGLGRCGSSLMMKMLHRGGVEPHCEPHRLGNSYESDDILRLPGVDGWMDALPGKAVKLLDPHHCTPPERFAYDLIWLDRDEIQQARSQLKLLKALHPGEGIPTNRLAVRAMAAGLYRNRRAALDVLEALPDHRLLKLRFEDMILHPGLPVWRLVRFLDLPPRRAEAMAAVVHARGPACLPHLAELEHAHA